VAWRKWSPMKIAEVESILVADSHYVRITTDDGTTGLGQSAAWAYPDAVHAVLQQFKSYLVGRDPLRTEHHWQYLYRMGPFRGSILGGAISAVDIALWDLKGKHYQAPIWDLLGGKCRDRIRLYLILVDETPEGLARLAKSATDEGFTAVKFDPLPSSYKDMTLSRLAVTASEMVGAVREEVGPDVDIILELHRRLSPLQVSTLADAVRPYRPLCIEDPIQLDSISSQAELARKLDIPLAIGERLHTIWEFRELLVQGGPLYVRPDVGLAGGITHCKKIAAIAESFHVPVVAHNFLGPVLTAASVHLDASIPNFLVQEYHAVADEGPRSAGFPGALIRDGGYLPVPDAPGLGVEIDPSMVVSQWPDGHSFTNTPLRADGSVAHAT
jgi:galactonate dehydratase